MAEDTPMAPAPAASAAAPATSSASSPSSSVTADIAHNLATLRSAVAILEPRLTTRVLRTLTSIRKRLVGQPSALRESIEAAFPAGALRPSSVVSELGS